MAPLKSPLPPEDWAQAHGCCAGPRNNSAGQVVDYDPEASGKLWSGAAATTTGFRRIIDARIVFTILHHGVREFATSHTKNFAEFEFDTAWDPVAP